MALSLLHHGCRNGESTNSHVARLADHILAAVFLKKFVKEGVSWIHMDLSPAAKPGGLGHVTTEETGFGVRASLALVLDHWDEIAG